MEKILHRLQNKKIVFLSYLALPFLLFASIQDKKVFYYYFLVTLGLTVITSTFRSVTKYYNMRDFDIALLTVIKFVHISTIFYTPKIVWMINGMAIFLLFLSFSYRHSRIGLTEILKNKLFVIIYMALYLTLFYRSVPPGLFLAIYGIVLAVVFTYTLLCAVKSNHFYRGLLYGSVSVITLVLLARYSMEELSSFYLYVESIFIGLCFVCYLNWYCHTVYHGYFPFIKKEKVDKFFDKYALINIFGLAALAVIILKLPLNKLVIINCSLIVIVTWIFYSAYVAFLNLAVNFEEIANLDDFKERSEIKSFFESLPEDVKNKLWAEMEIVRARKQRCDQCKVICNTIKHMPLFMKHIIEK